jgi:glyoxylase-like metal-dependent hydrolase (beta-lactamase superfamily II)
MELGLVDALEAGEIAPGVRIEPAPGHSSGSVVVHAEDAVFVGHLFLHPAQLVAVERAELDEDPEMTIKTRRAVLEEAKARNLRLYGDLWAEPGWRYAP